MWQHRWLKWYGWIVLMGGPVLSAASTSDMLGHAIASWNQDRPKQTIEKTAKAMQAVGRKTMHQGQPMVAALPELISLTNAWVPDVIADDDSMTLSLPATFSQGEDQCHISYQWDGQAFMCQPMDNCQPKAVDWVCQNLTIAHPKAATGLSLAQRQALYQKTAGSPNLSKAADTINALQKQVNYDQATSVQQGWPTLQKEVQLSSLANPSVPVIASWGRKVNVQVSDALPSQMQGDNCEITYWQSSKHQRWQCQPSIACGNMTIDWLCAGAHRVFGQSFAEQQAEYRREQRQRQALPEAQKASEQILDIAKGLKQEAIALNQETAVFESLTTGAIPHVKVQPRSVTMILVPDFALPDQTCHIRYTQSNPGFVCHASDGCPNFVAAGVCGTVPQK